MNNNASASKVIQHQVFRTRVHERNKQQTTVLMPRRKTEVSKQTETAKTSCLQNNSCGASSEEGDGGGGGVRSGLSVGAAVRRPPRLGYGFFVLFLHEPHRHRYGLGWSR